MIKFLLLLTLLQGCDGIIKEYKAIHNAQYVIECKHPKGHLLKYKVKLSELNVPHAFSTGVWNFKTIDNMEVFSSFCHAEIVKN